MKLNKKIKKGLKTQNKEAVEPKIFLTQDEDGHLKMDDEMGKLLFGDPKINQETQRGNMKGLKITELEEGKIYWCQLSERNVLMHSPATAYVYDKTKGCYTFITIEDYQLKYKPDCKHAYVNNMTSTDNNCLICNIPESQH